MPTNRRHTEFFGPDLGRGPFSSNNAAVASVQIATALAQLHTPLLRDTTEILDHASFIRSLADTLFPDQASAIRFNVGDEDSDAIEVTIYDDSRQYSLLHVWLADDTGKGETVTTPSEVTWPGGAILETITLRKRYFIISPNTGVVSVTIKYTGAHDYRLAVARNGRIYYSPLIRFEV
ncbi:MAG: hypothetical protein KDA32_14565 [Phycisphaerales bacterium]|nr:hypothetical protein [Phycisphaerales bacterium]